MAKGGWFLGFWFRIESPVPPKCKPLLPAFRERFALIPPMDPLIQDSTLKLS